MDWVLGIGCECCGLRKTAAGCVVPFSPFFSIQGGKSVRPRLMLAAPFEVSIYRPSAASAFLLCYLLVQKKTPSFRTHAPLFRTPRPPKSFQSIVEQSSNPGLSSLPNHIQTVFTTVVSLVSFPLREAPMVLFQSFCSGRRSKREEARGFMKVGHYSLQQVIVIVPPTEQMIAGMFSGFP